MAFNAPPAMSMHDRCMPLAVFTVHPSLRAGESLCSEPLAAALSAVPLACAALHASTASASLAMLLRRCTTTHGGSRLHATPQPRASMHALTAAAASHSALAASSLPIAARAAATYSAATLRPMLAARSIHALSTASSSALLAHHRHRAGGGSPGGSGAQSHAQLLAEQWARATRHMNMHHVHERRMHSSSDRANSQQQQSQQQQQQRERSQHQHQQRSGSDHQSSSSSDHSSSSSSSSSSTAASSNPLWSFLRLLRRAFDWYAHKLDTHPIKTQGLTSGSLFALGDWTAQRYEVQLDADKGIDVSDRPYINLLRLAACTSFGLFVLGPCGHHWYSRLDVYTNRLYRPRSWKNVGLKVALDTAIFNPIFLVIFFTSVSLIEGLTIKDIGYKLYRDFVPRCVRRGARLCCCWSCCRRGVKRLCMRRCVSRLMCCLFAGHLAAIVFLCVRSYAVDCSIWPPIQTINFRFVPVKFQLLVVNLGCYFDDVFLSYVQHNGMCGGSARSRAALQCEHAGAWRSSCVASAGC